MNNVAKELGILLADSYVLYLKTQNFHWNVTGPHFASLHALFEEQYTDLATAVDDIAERIRSLGFAAPASFKAYEKLATIADAPEAVLTADEMVEALAQDQTLIGKTLNAVLKLAQEAEDEVTIGLVIDRLTVHEKNAWMLNSSLPDSLKTNTLQVAS